MEKNLRARSSVIENSKNININIYCIYNKNKMKKKIIII